MYFSEKLLFKGIEDKNEVMSANENGDEVLNAFLLCKSLSDNIFEIFELSEIRVKHYFNKPYKVLGIAGGKQNCMLMAKEIIENYLKDRGTLEGLKESL